MNSLVKGVKIGEMELKGYKLSVISDKICEALMYSMVNNTV